MQTLADEIYGEAAEGFRKEMIRAVEEGTGRGARFEELGREMGALLTATPDLLRQSDKFAKKPWASQIDAMAVWASPGLLAAKTGSRISQGPTFLTGLGGPLRAVGEIAGAKVGGVPLEAPLKRSLIESQRPNYVERRPQSMPTADTTRPTSRRKGGMSTSAWQKTTLDRADRR